VEPTECQCELCGRRYVHDFRRGHTRRFCNSCRSNRLGVDRLELKRRMVEYKGAACQLCGYDGCLPALDFHHLDPAKKSFRLAGAHTRSWASLKEELDKCLLVCSNCHIEIEARGRAGRRGPTLPPGDAPPELLSTCRVCGRRYVYNRRKGHTKSRCNSCGGSRSSPEARHALKAELLELAGGSCAICGYERSIHSLTFHHVDPLRKRFNIAGSHGRNIAALRAEVAKCVVLCANCHDAVEAGAAVVPPAAVRRVMTATKAVPELTRNPTGRPRADRDRRSR
jgi:hypothetical protein